MMRRPADPAWAQLRTNMADVVWPPISAGPPAVLAAYLRQLEDTQWLPTETLVARQYEQLVPVARYGARHSKVFKARLARAHLKPDDLGTPEGLRRLPLLTRREIQSARDGLYCDKVPDGHAPLFEGRTSGSTGEPVVVGRSSICHFDWMAMTMREHLWQRRDFSGRLAAVRANIDAPREGPDWGPPANLLFATGRSLGLPITLAIERLYEALAAFAPDNVLVYPSMLDALTQYCRAHNLALPSLRHIRTIGETLSPHVREEAKEIFPARLSDVYSSQEAGYIAVECPDSGLYHTMAENLIVEVLNEGGELCAPGEVGRIAVTDVHNYAMPVVRYDIGDYAEASAPCPCGRGLPTLARVLGRERNLILMPDGTRHWPLTGSRHIRSIAPVFQYQLAQLDRENLEARFVVERVLTAEEEDRLRERIVASVGHPFVVTLKYFEGRLPAGKNGKFEEFVCQARP